MFQNRRGKIGVFDSGLGGLTVLKKIVALMPNRGYLYLGDNLRAPYGDRSQKEIFRYTLAGVEWLFTNGAEIVILACNTASAGALRKIQQDILPFKYPSKRVLGIIIPTAENATSFTKSGHIGVLATKATVASKVFKKEAGKHNLEMQIVCQSGGKLVEMIEFDENKNRLSAEIKNVVNKLLSKDELIDAVILGCTHYALIKNQIRQVVPKGINVISQGDIIAVKLLDYINRHDAIQEKLEKQFSVSFYTTSDNGDVKKKMAQFYGANIPISVAIYEIE
jgi:glutamate racemase